MSDARPDPAPETTPTSLRQAASSAGLLVVVVGILVWSRSRQSGPPEHRPAPTPPAVASLAVSAPPEGFASLERVATPEPPAPVEPDAELEGLARRAEADVTRLAAKRGAWTVQVSRHCSVPLVQEKVRRHGGARELLILPAEHGERACFVVCWGTYADRAAALQGVSTVPAPLRGDGKPFARAAAEVLP